MISSINIYCQDSFELTGYWGLPNTVTGTVLGFESNPSNFSFIKDWQFNILYGSEFSGEVNSTLYSIGISKTISAHNISVRYTPGYQKEFIQSTGETIIFNDSSSQSLSASYNYKELFGFGYSYKFSSQLNTGISLRYFNQEFNREIGTPVFGDTSNYFIRENLNEKINTWKADIGIDFNLNDKFKFKAATVNLLNFGDETQNDEFKGFELKQDLNAFIAASYLPAEQINFNLLFETSKSFQAGITGSAGNFIYGLTSFHDTYQQPFIAGVIPAFGYKNDFINVLLSGIKYFTDRKSSQDFNNFSSEGIHNIINNGYSYDKAVLSVSFVLNTLEVQKLKLIDVETVSDIYPALLNNYLSTPFAYGTVVNLTNENLEVKPSSKINGMHNEEIQSPSIIINPFDTVKVPYYTVIPENYKGDKPVLSYADFYIATSNNEPEDHIQKAILVNGINAWDGKVINLRYFINRDINFSMNYSKTVLSSYKELLDTIPAALSVFYKAKLLFNDFIKRLVYTSDPRATAEYVQFPKQTIEIKGGDCDDLSVAYCSLLESVGIQTALVDYKPDGDVRHVNVLFNTELDPNQAKFITTNDNKYFIRANNKSKDEIWIPVETTSLTDFNDAWNIGVEKFNKDAIDDLGIAKGTVEIIDVY